MPRLSWSIDFITDLPHSEDYKYLLLCIDDFSGYAIGIPTVNTTTIEIIKGLKSHIFTPFGIPNSIRTDEQSGFYNSTQFHDFISKHGITYNSTAVASPFSNGRVESHVKNIKHLARKFLFQENILDQWHTYLPHLTQTLNKTVNSYGSTSEQIMFGYKNNNPNDIIRFAVDTSDVEKYNKYLEHIESLRLKTRTKANDKCKSNTTFKNRHNVCKEFNNGDIVLHRQMQVSTGTSSKWKPTFNGPYVIEQILPDKNTAVLQHLHTKAMIKAHFQNIMHFDYDVNNQTIPKNSKLPF